MCDAPAGDALYASFFSGLAASQLLAGPEACGRTLRALTELCVAHCAASQGPPQPGGAPGALNFAAVDAYARLALALARHHGECCCEGRAPPPPRAALLSAAFAACASVLLRDQEERRGAFNPRPYFRLVSCWVGELSPPDPGLDLAHPPVVASLGRLLLAVQPLRAPGFAFAWLELVSHRRLVPVLCGAGGPPPGPADAAPPGWPLLQALLVGALRFLEPRLRAAELPEPARVLYRGLLRVLLLLLHDAPEFLVAAAPGLCASLPPSCVQMRNLVLSAFPRNMRLPDPFTPNLQVASLPDIRAPPRTAPGWDAPLGSERGAALLGALAPGAPPAALAAALCLPPGAQHAAGTRYDVPLLNALVLRVGGAGAASAAGAPDALAATPHAAVFSRLAAELDAEGRFLLLNAAANQLRFPNSHTHYFSCLLLHLFAEAPHEAVREQVTRVLLERLIVNRPHPWGLLVTFIELIKNPRYAFWMHAFTRCHPEISAVFASVAQSVSSGGQPATVVERFPAARAAFGGGAGDGLGAGGARAY